MSDNNFIQVGEMTACGHCEPEKYGEGMRQAQDILGDKMPSCTCKCHTKGICITCYENCQTVGTCPHVAPKNVLTDIKTEHLKELRESGVEITEVAPKEEEIYLDILDSLDVRDAENLKAYIASHYIPKERVEKVLAFELDIYDSGMAEHYAILNLRSSLLSEDK